MTEHFIMRRARTESERDAAQEHEQVCAAMTYDEGPVCTRSLGHKGEHVAASGTLILWKWKE